MRPRPDVAFLGFGLLIGVAAPVDAEPGRTQPGGLLGGQMGDRKAPITIASDSLEYDYKANVVVYHGDVTAAQGLMKLRSDTLTITFRKRDGTSPGADTPAPEGQRVRDIVAVGNIRIDHGTRWATGGRAVFDDTRRTLVLTEDPVLHDGANEVAGDRVVVYLDEDRSVVEGGRKRVKAILYPGAETDTKDRPTARPEAATAQAAVP